MRFFGRGSQPLCDRHYYARHADGHFLSTSDEMLPILISGGAGAALIVQILGIKVIFAIASGVLLDIFLPQKFIRHKQEPDIEAFCQREKCKCDDKENIWHSAYKHTEKISIFIFIFSLIVNAVLHLAAERPCSCC